MTASETPTFAPVPRTVLDYQAAAEYMGMNLDGRSDESVKRALDRLCDRKQLTATIIFGRRVFRIKDLDNCLDRAAGSVT